MTEAVEAIFGFAVRELAANRVEIRCDERNVRSAAVAERLGFPLEGVLRSDARATDGSLRNTKVYAKVRGLDY